MPSYRGRAAFQPAQTVTGGGGGPPGTGDTVRLGPEYGETDAIEVGTAVTFTKLTIKPTIAAGIALAFAQLRMTFGQLAAGVAVAFTRLRLGPFNLAAGVAVKGRLRVLNILYTPVAVNLIQGAATQVANHTSIFTGFDPFLIRPETVAGVTADKRVAYFKWNLTGYDGTTIDSYELIFVFQATNPSLTLAGNITIEMRSTPTDPWPGTPPTYAAAEPITVGTAEGTLVTNVAANTTQTVYGYIPAADGLSALGDWVYARVTTDLVAATTALAMQIRTFDVDGNPATIPHQAPYADLDITM